MMYGQKDFKLFLSIVNKYYCSVM